MDSALSLNQGQVQEIEKTMLVNHMCKFWHPLFTDWTKHPDFVLSLVCDEFISFMNIRLWLHLLYDVLCSIAQGIYFENQL